MLLEPALAVEELAGQRLPRGQVAVGSTHIAPTGSHCPRATASRTRAKSAARAPPATRMLCLRAREAVLGIRVHQPQLRGRRAHELAPRLLERPQPRPCQGERGRSRSRCSSPSGGESWAAATVAVEREGVQLGAEQSRPGPGRRPARAPARRAPSRSYRSLPRPSVEAGEPRAQRDNAAHTLARLAEAEQVVACELELERDPLAALGARDERRRRPDHARPGVEPLDRLAAEPQRRLAARVEQRSTRAPAQPSGTTRSRAASTWRTAGRAPRPAPRRDREAERLLARDAADRARDLQPLDRDALRVHAPPRPLDLPGDPVPRVPAVRQHGDPGYPHRPAANPVWRRVPPWQRPTSSSPAGGW